MGCGCNGMGTLTSMVAPNMTIRQSMLDRIVATAPVDSASGGTNKNVIIAVGVLALLGAGAVALVMSRKKSFEANSLKSHTKKMWKDYWKIEGKKHKKKAKKARKKAKKFWKKARKWGYWPRRRRSSWRRRPWWRRRRYGRWYRRGRWY